MIGRTDTARGVAFMVGSALFFSLMSALVKAAGERLPSQEIVLARGVLSLALSYALVRRAGVSPWGVNRGLLFLRGLFGFLGLSCFYAALTRLPLAEATVIQYTNPIFTALIAAVWLRERIGVATAAGIGVALAGVASIARPVGLLRGEGTLEPTAVAIALAGALLSALAYTTVRRLSRSEHPLVIVFWFPLLTVPATAPWVLPYAIWPNPREWVILIGVGLTTQIAQVLLTRGLALVPAAQATAIGYLQIVFASVWGWWLFAESPDGWTYGGALLVLAGTSAVALGGGRPAAAPDGAPPAR